MTLTASPRARLDINFVILRDGRHVHLDDIATAAEGQAVLDELDGSILVIRAQLESGEAEARPWHWRKSARLALSKKQNIRPRLQHRIGELRRIERQATQPPRGDGSGRLRGENRRKAFINAAETLLPPETMVEIWALAKQQDPVAFKDVGVRA